MNIQDLDSLLYPCGRCGCLVAATTLRLLEYNVPRQDDPDEKVHISSLRCQDPVACEARRWSQHGPEKIDDIPLDELVEGEPLFRCMGCDAARIADEVVVSVVTDEEGPFPEITCKNSTECLLYQSSAEYRALQEQVRDGLKDFDDEN